VGPPLVSLCVAFVAGFAATKTISYEWRSSVILWLFVGVIGLFLSQLTLLFFGLQEYLDRLPEFRILFDFIAAYVGSFFVAAFLHVLKPV
jgi:uncharacterized membrane protein YeaQ/YmgE (transglycosylase-associated protein family)